MSKRSIQVGLDAVPLLCFPFGGSGASFYRQWARGEADVVPLVPVQLPGREELFRERCYRGMRDAVDGLLPVVKHLSNGRPRIALFGHCLGAAIAYEIACALRDDPDVEVAALFVSGALAPTRQQPRLATGLPDGAFIARVRENGYNVAALDDPELCEIVLPMLRADVELLESYRPTSTEPLSIPIISVRGDHDEHVSAADASEWSRFTSNRFEAVEFPGDHMYLAADPTLLLRHIEDVLRRTVRMAAIP